MRYNKQPTATKCDAIIRRRNEIQKRARRDSSAIACEIYGARSARSAIGAKNRVHARGGKIARYREN